MFEKLKILTVMQLSEKIKIKSDKTFQQKLGTVGKEIVAMGISYGFFTGLFYLLFQLLYLRATSNLFISAIFLMQLISIVTCIVSMSSSLYASKDNYLLLSYPVKHIYVYVSKLLVSYVLELRKSLLFVFPLFMAYATMVKGIISATFIILGIIYSILIPLFPVLIGAFLTIPIYYIKKLIFKYSIAKIVATILVFAGLIYITTTIISALPEQIRIVELFNKFLNNLENTLDNFNKFSIYVSNVGYSMLGIETIKNILILLAYLIGFGVLSIGTSLPLFFKIASSAGENSVEKKHGNKNVAHKSTFLTFSRKELTLSIRNIGDFINNYSFLFALPFVIAIISSIYVRIDRNALGIAMTYSFIGLMSLLMLSASNTASATALSSEGSEFVLLKTAPGKTINIVWAKLLVNVVVSLLSIIITFIYLLNVLKNHVDQTMLWIVFIGITIIDIGLIMWSIQLDILNPTLNQYANSGTRSELKNFSTSILVGTVVSVIYSAILILAFIIDISVTVLALIVIGVAVLFTGIRLYFLINYLNAYFDDIQL